MPTNTPVVTIPVRLSEPEHRNLANFFGRYRKASDGYAFYIMTELRAEWFRLLRDSGLVLADTKQKRGMFKVPGAEMQALTLKQALEVAKHIASRNQWEGSSS